MSSVRIIALCFVFSFCPKQLLHIRLCSSVGNGLCHVHCALCEMTSKGRLWFPGRVIPFPGLVSESLGRYPLCEGSIGQISYQHFRGRAKNQLNASWEFITESPDPIAKNVKV